MQTETQTEFAVGFDSEAQWSTELTNDYQNYRHAGWQFVTTLNAGVNQFIAKRGKAEVYSIAQQCTGLSLSRLQNLVSMANKPSSRYAAANGLEIAHAEAVLGLVDSEAIKYLDHALAEGKSATAIGAMIREDRQAKAKAVVTKDIPDAGNEPEARHYVSAEPDDVPFSNGHNVLYDDVDARAEHYAGSGSGYDWQDEDDAMTYTIDEVYSLIQRAVNRLKDVDANSQRTVGEWLGFIGRQCY